MFLLKLYEVILLKVKAKAEWIEKEIACFNTFDRSYQVSSSQMNVNKGGTVTVAYEFMKHDYKIAVAAFCLLPLTCWQVL